MNLLPTIRTSLGITLATLLVAGTTGASTLDSERFTFDVYLDEDEIGFHRYEIREHRDGTIMRTEADFEVRLLFFTAYEYEHRNSEVWRDGCLRNIEARTNSNGDRYEVAGTWRDGTFVLETGSDQRRFSDCVRTFAYWDRKLLDAERLLNSQTGEYVEVALTSLPAGVIEFGDQILPVERYRLTAQGMDIQLAYAAESGEWVGLDTTVRGGRTLRYRRDPAELGVRGELRLSEAAAQESR
jgi:hypothetical protein